MLSAIGRGGERHGIAKMLTQTRPDTLLRFGRIRYVLYFHLTRKPRRGYYEMRDLRRRA